MNIIVCNDTRTESFPEEFDWKAPNAHALARKQRESINMDQRLCVDLRKSGHNVALFDGYESNGTSKVTDPNKAAGRLAQLITEHEAAGMVFDLHYFGNFDYGVNCLKQLRNLRAVPQDMKLVIYSRFIKEPNGDFPRRLVEDCGISLDHIIDRHQKGIETVVALFRRA
jgi:hypothetical protein